jgi:hypothetical protein
VTGDMRSALARSGSTCDAIAARIASVLRGILACRAPRTPRRRFHSDAASAMSVEAGYTTRHADKHRNLVGSQQPMAQTSPAGQSSWERQPAAVAQSGPSDCTQTPPPPIFFEQKHVPWHPPPPRSRLQVNGSRHLSTQRLRAQTPPLGQSRLRVQDWAAACCAPSPRTVHSVLPSSPPSSRRRGTMPVVPRDVGPVVCVLRGRPPSINPMNAQPGSDFVFLSIEEGRDDHFSRPQSRLVRQERGHPGPYSWHEALVHLEPSVPSPPAVVPGRSCSPSERLPNRRVQSPPNSLLSLEAQSSGPAMRLYCHEGNALGHSRPSRRRPCLPWSSRAGE